MKVIEDNPVSLKPWQEGVLLLAIIGIATLLRLYRLGEWSFWFDELFSLQVSLDLFHNLQNDLHYAVREHLLTSILMLTAVSLTEVNEFYARLMPALVGVLTIPILYIFVRRWFDAGTALLFGLLLALSPWHLYWSQNARFYITLLLVYWLALFFFYDGYERQRWQSYVLCVLFLALAVSERLLGLFIVPVLMLFVISAGVWQAKRPFNWRFVGILLAIGLGMALLFGFNFVRNPDMWFLLYGDPASRSPFTFVLRHLQAVDFHVVILAAVGTIVLYQQKEKSLPLWLSSIIVPVGITTLLSFVQFTHPRYIFIALIGWLILAAVGLKFILQRVLASGGERWVATAVLLLIILLPITELKDYYTIQAGGRAELKDAFAYVEAHADEGDIIFSNDDAVGEYYLTHLEASPMREPTEQIEMAMNCDYESGIWVVMNGDTRAEYNFITWVREHAHRVNYDGYNIKLYRLPAELCL